MRVISQDGTIDLPYEQVIIRRHDKSIYLMEHLTSDVEIAKYSTEEKAKKAIEMLRTCALVVKEDFTTFTISYYFQFPEDEGLE